MDYLNSIAYGFSIAFQPINLLYCFWGVFIGNLIGVLPGIGPGGTIALLLPFTLGMSPVAGVIMLAGLYYGAMYGGSITSILVNIPGESASVVTCLDGYQMARQGRAGAALGISAFGSFLAGTAGEIFLRGHGIGGRGSTRPPGNGTLWHRGSIDEHGRIRRGRCSQGQNQGTSP